MSDDLQSTQSVVEHLGGAVTSGGFAAWMMHMWKEFKADKKEAAREAKEEAKEERRVKSEKDLAVTVERLTNKIDKLSSDISERRAEGAAALQGVKESFASLMEKVEQLRERVGDLEAKR